MDRKSFLKTAVVAAGTVSSVAAMAKPASNNSEQKQHLQQFYELRVYELKNADQQKMVEDYFRQAAIPALNNLGSKNVGVFTELKPAGQTRIFVLIPYQSMQDFVNVEENLLKNAAYKQAAAAYLQAPATMPAYERINSSLLQAFSNTPEMVLPEKKERIFELRRYESSGEMAGKKKVEMFNEIGESSIFKRLGFKPVFFARTLIGEMRPNLMYMITFDDLADHDAKWKTFGGDAEWKKISSVPEYADAKIVSHITSTLLVPAAYSQI